MTDVRIVRAHHPGRTIGFLTLDTQPSLSGQLVHQRSSSFQLGHQTRALPEALSPARRNLGPKPQKRYLNRIIVAASFATRRAKRSLSVGYPTFAEITRGVGPHLVGLDHLAAALPNDASFKPMTFSWLQQVVIFINAVGCGTR